MIETVAASYLYNRSFKLAEKCTALLAVSVPASDEQLQVLWRDINDFTGEAKEKSGEYLIVRVLEKASGRIGYATTCTITHEQKKHISYALGHLSFAQGFALAILTQRLQEEKEGGAQ